MPTRFGRSALVAAACVVLAGCSTANAVADAVARDRAKVAVNAAVAERLPGVNVSPVTDCVIDNATAQEILLFGTNAAVGQTSENIVLLEQVLQRAGTIQCLTERAAPALLQVLAA